MKLLRMLKIETMKLVAASLCLGCILYEGMENNLFAQEAVVGDLNSTSYKSYLENHSLVLVDIYAPWCPPCKRLSPIIDELAQVYNCCDRAEQQVYFVKMNLDNNKQLGAELGIRSIPTILFYKKGQEVARVVGFIGKEALEAKLKEVLLKAP